jgi:F-type H+-transporting ATPase subunit epsilon
MAFELTILTPHKKLVEGISVDELVAPGFKGQLQILSGHADFVTILNTGILSWKGSSGSGKATISTGFLEICNQKITIIAEVSELPNEIDLARAKAAAEKSQKIIEAGGVDDSDFRKYELKLQRAVARQSIQSGDN